MKIFKTILLKWRQIIPAIAIIIIIVAFYYWLNAETQEKIVPANTATTSVPVAPSSIQPPESSLPAILFSPPIDRALERVTKKPFGIKISPDNSPIQPERFSGYHTGVDFETFADETDKEIPIFAVCDGNLLVKEYISGYGGVAVQLCELDGQDLTILYGHLKLSSIVASKGQQIAAGDKIGILGQGFSQETDGERKHLHLAVHKGSDINIKGYVQNQEELSNWIDIRRYLSV